MNSQQRLRLRGTQMLYEQLEKDSEDYLHAYALYLRLERNFKATIFGPTNDNSTELIIILSELNEITERLFDKTFDRYCEDTKNQALPSERSEDAGAPQIEVKILHKIIPTAYCQSLQTEDFPLVRVTIDNSDRRAKDVTVHAHTFIEDYSDAAKGSLTVKKGEKDHLDLLPVFKHSMLSTINDMRRVTLHYSVTQTAPEAKVLINSTESVHLMPFNEALIAIKNTEQDTQDLTRYLVAWVTPQKVEVERIKRQAINYYSRFNGYQDGTSESVREQARAIFLALRDTGFVYAHSTLSWKIKPDQITQKVSLPRECLENGMCTNCLDGAVLFASILELSGIEPLLVLVPGHAFVGWRVEPETEDYEFLETSLIHTGDFEQAQSSALRLYEDARTHDYFGNQLFDDDGFARLIDVKRYRQEKIYALE